MSDKGGGGEGEEEEDVTSTPGTLSVITEPPRTKSIREEYIETQAKQIDKARHAVTIELIVSLVILITGLIAFIFALIFWLRLTEVTPQEIPAPLLDTSQGYIQYSSNQLYFAVFDTGFSVLRQGPRPNNLYQQGELLWDAGIVAPPGSVYNFYATGILDIVAPNGDVLWSNRDELLPTRPDGPYVLLVRDEGYLAIQTQEPTPQVIWRRPTVGASVIPVAQISGGEEIKANQKYYSENKDAYLIFDATKAILSLKAVDLKQGGVETLIWQSPAPTREFSPPTIAQLSYWGNLSISASDRTLLWSSQTANFQPNIKYWLRVEGVSDITSSSFAALTLFRQSFGEDPFAFWTVDSKSQSNNNNLYSLGTGETLKQGTVLFSKNLNAEAKWNAQGFFSVWIQGVEMTSTGVEGPSMEMDIATGQMFQRNSSDTIVWSNYAPVPEIRYPVYFTLGNNGTLFWTVEDGSLIASATSLYHNKAAYVVPPSNPKI